MNGYDEAFCYGAHDGVLRSLVHLFKYEGIRPLSQHLGNLMFTALPRDRTWDAIVPMPMHWWRQWRRGYNQAEMLARTLSRRTGVPVRKMVARKKATALQAGLSGSDRRRNVAGAFALRRGQRADGLRVLLVDDVLTSGATARACALTLKQAGARQVSVLTVSRADRRSPATAQPDTGPPASTREGDTVNA